MTSQTATFKLLNFFGFETPQVSEVKPSTLRLTTMGVLARQLTKIMTDAIGQTERIDRSLSLDPSNFKRVGQEIQYESKNGIYVVTKTTCTCPDHERRGLPCKHIYAFNRLGIEDLLK